MNISSSTHHQAVELNNLAVTEIDNGDAKAAIVKLKKALAIAKHCWTTTPDGHELNDDFNTNEVQQQNKGITSLDDFVTASSSKSTTTLGATAMDCADDDDVETIEGGSNSNRSRSYIYCQAIHVVPEAVGRDNNSRQQLSAVIVFNLALAHHLVSEALDEKQQQHYVFLMRAAKLYELAWQLVERKVGHNSPLFMMVIVNNLGVAYQNLGEMENAQKSFQHLLSTMLFLMDCGHHNNVFAKTKNHHLLQDGFFRNVSPLFLQQSTAAAA